MSENVILEKIKGLEALINEKFKENAKEHERIEIQVKKTNGDVMGLKLWRSRLIGGFIVLSMIIIPIGIYIITDLI